MRVALVTASSRGLGAAIARRLGRDGLAVAGPQPGALVSDAGWQNHLAQLDFGFIPVERHADVPDSVKDAYRASVPAGRMGVPADIAHAVSFFASDGAGFITGQRITVDGGRSLGS
jgi:NAD(P)-dependent dehydrogenase (short-subunit alcohol dehydrogenase family)